MRWWVWLILGGVAVVAIQVLVILGLARGGPRSRYPGFAESPAESGADSLRTSAMMSVRAHAEPLATEYLDLFMPFDQAIGLLRREMENQVPGEESRRRRALAILTSYGLEYSDRGWHIGRFRKEIDELGGDRVDILSRADALDPRSSAEERFPIVADWFEELTESCPWQDLEGGIPPWSADSPIEWNYTVKVPRLVSDIARSFDPQEWHDSGTYFPSTYLADVQAPCCPSSGSSTCNFTDGGTGKPPATPVLAAGKPYSTRPFYENYCYDQGGGCGSCGPSCQVDFRNILCVDAKYDFDPVWSQLAPYAKEYEVHFDLGRWLRSSVLGTTQSDKGAGPYTYEILQDRGSIRVEKIPPGSAPGTASPWSQVRLTKKLQFASSAPTDAARVVLREYANEIGQQIADQACVNIPPESWGSPWWLLLPAPLRQVELRR